MKQGKIIVVDDNQSIRTALKLLLSSQYESVELLASPVNLLSTIAAEAPDVVLLDMNFRQGINDGNEGLYWLGQIKERYARLPVVLFTAYADIDLAVKALKRGATDFVVKPWDNHKLIETLHSAVEINRKRQEKSPQSGQRTDTQAYEFWGTSEAIRRVRELADKVAPSDANVLITGENGTGKEILARYIHHQSARKMQSMVTVDMGSLSETLFESELFGHMRGAFTDAKTDRTGKFEEAHGGTLFLDEIANLSLPMQAKLLTALQSRAVTRVGSNQPTPIDIRLIVATNANINESIAQGLFREDLYYRINTICIEMPPLRRRVEDIIPMAQFFLTRYSRRYNRGKLKFNPESEEMMRQYTWPGNVRELQHAVEKAVILSSDSIVKMELPIQEAQPHTAPEPPQGAVWGGSLEDMERRIISAAMKRFDGNLSRVADELGISRPTLYNKLKKYGL